MTEPEAMAYTINYFKKKDASAIMMRNAIFSKYADKAEPWIVSEDCLQTYGIETSLNGSEVIEWWQNQGAYKPINSGKAIEVLSEEDYDNAKKYAITEAGRSRVQD